MKFSTYFSQTDLIQAVERIIGDKDSVSFDLFDTLLVRRIHDPDLVKLPTARYISRLARNRGVNLSWEKIQMRRDEIEREHRAVTGQSFPDHEACYPRFMVELLQEIFQEKYSPELLEMVTAYELKMENSMLVPRSAFKAWVADLARRGKRIFIISDMYLPATHLRDLVQHAGLLEFVEDVISSADSFQAKASGTGYPLIAERFGLQYESWVHVGDNPISDGVRPAEHGIASFIIQDPGEDQRKSVVKRIYNYSDGRRFWRGRALQQVMAPLEGENIERSALYVDGYNFIGPLIGMFLMEIAERCRKNGITKLFFLSREGWTFKKYWEAAIPIIYPEAEWLPEVEYLYVSRMALAGASCAQAGLRKASADIAFLPPGNRDFRDVCRIFSLDADGFAAHLDRFGLSADTCLSHIHEGYEQENRKRFEALLGDDEFQQEVRKQSRAAGAAAEKYFTDIGLFTHEKVGLVDIGWLGTIQRWLFDTISHREDKPRCFGFLFGATRGIPYPEDDYNRIEGIVYDKNRFDLAASAIFYIRDLFEEACRAPHPTLNGYSLDGEDYKLVFRQTQDAVGVAEKEQDNYFAPLQQGIFDSAERFGYGVSLLGYDAEDCKYWFNYLLVSKLAFPRAKEVKVIKHKHHLDDFHGSKQPKANFRDEEKGLWDYSPLRLRIDPLLRLRAYLTHLRRRINQ